MKQYSFADVVLLINGTEITGWWEGDDVIRLARRNDSTTDVVGADGAMTIAISSDRSGTCEFTLKQTSDSNQLLSGLVAAAENGAFVPVLIQMKDTRGGDLGAGTAGYIPKPADMTRGTGLNSQSWTITVENLVLLHNGAEAI